SASDLRERSFVDVPCGRDPRTSRLGGRRLARRPTHEDGSARSAERRACPVSVPFRQREQSEGAGTQFPYCKSKRVWETLSVLAPDRAGEWISSLSDGCPDSTRSRRPRSRV